MTVPQEISQQFHTVDRWLALEHGPLLILDVAIVLGLVYWFYMMIRGTRGTRILAGLALVELVMLIARFAQLQILSWLMSKTFTVLLVAIPVIFQPELRRALGKIGERSLRRSRTVSFSTIKEITRASEEMAKEKVGALILVKRNTGMDAVVESGVRLNALVSSKLLRSIFTPGTELHDGACVIDKNVIVAAGCFYVSELSDNAVLKYGARHRAAVGFSLESDALVISISQERGAVSLAFDGKLVENVTAEELEEALGSKAANPLPPRRGSRQAGKKQRRRSVAVR